MRSLAFGSNIPSGTGPTQDRLCLSLYSLSMTPTEARLRHCTLVHREPNVRVSRRRKPRRRSTPRQFCELNCDWNPSPSRRVGNSRTMKGGARREQDGNNVIRLRYRTDVVTALRATVRAAFPSASAVRLARVLLGQPKAKRTPCLGRCRRPAAKPFEHPHRDTHQLIIAGSEPISARPNVVLHASAHSIRSAR